MLEKLNGRLVMLADLAVLVVAKTLHDLRACENSPAVDRHETVVRLQPPWPVIARCRIPPLPEGYIAGLLAEDAVL